ncbi:MAG: hypothetical protein HY002_19165 [Candidatus Rokubacteria bacterium]|nr:hypothetical protein [Candidatus Rokubacteria bacterium]
MRRAVGAALGGVAALLLALDLASPMAGRAQPLGVRQLANEAPQILQELAQLRGLPSPGLPPRVVVRSREERRRFIVGELNRKYPATRLDAERRAMVVWGLIPPGFDLRGFLTDLVVEQAAAYYDPIGKVMALANWLGSDEQREALTHELVHLLQDRQIDLDRFLTASPGKGDEALARQALIEGEAVALTLDRTLRRQGQDLGRLPDVASLQRAILVSATGPVVGRAPRFLRALLTFPYAPGLGFVHQFRRRYAWAEFSRLYADPPRSTAQILHPERYLDRREDPVPLSLPDLGPALGPGARRIIEDDAGEFGLAGILGEFLGDEAGAAGWRGDRYALWDDGRGTPVLVALSVWEDEATAAAFSEAYTRLLLRKHGLPTPTAGTPWLTAWRVGEQAFAVERRGREVLLLERAPASALDAIRSTLWASRPSARAHPVLSPAGGRALGEGSGNHPPHPGPAFSLPREGERAAAATARRPG